MRILKLSAILLAACLGVAYANDSTVTVLAAASLKECFQELGRGFESAHPGCEVKLSFAGSQQLASQIALGAPADVFASADNTQMQKAVVSHRVSASSVRVFALNRLVLAVAASAASRVHGVADLGASGLKFVTAARQVPVGQYTQRMLSLASRKQERGWLLRVRNNTVSQELDVRAILAKVELGQADAGVVYASDTKVASKTVVFRQIPEEYNVRAQYVIAPIDHSALAEAFVQYVLGNEGRKIESKYGFLLPG